MQNKFFKWKKYGRRHRASINDTALHNLIKKNNGFIQVKIALIQM